MYVKWQLTTSIKVLLITIIDTDIYFTFIDCLLNLKISPVIDAFTGNCYKAYFILLWFENGYVNQ